MEVQSMSAVAEVAKAVRVGCVVRLMGKVAPVIVRDIGADVFHSYCGNSDEYCGDGCQSAFGTCPTKSKRTRSHIRRHNHVMRMKTFNL